MKIMTVSDWKAKAVGYAAVTVMVAGIGAGIAWWVTSIKYDADIATLKSNQSDEREKWGREKSAIAVAAQQATADAITRMRHAQEAAAEADRAAQEKLANAKLENDALRADVTAGNKRVRILAANLAASKHTASGNPSASSVGDAVQIELSAVGSTAVLDLRESTQRDSEVIQYLQNYINDVAKQCKR